MWKSTQFFTGECSGSSSWWKRKEVTSYGSLESSNPWPFKIKLTTDHLRWDSLKIPPSKEFEENVVMSLNEAGRRALDAWIPVKVLVYDVDIRETYEVELAKKESFWFEPLPLPNDRQKKIKPSSSYLVDKELSLRDLGFGKTRQDFAYSIQPFKGIKKKRGLEWDQEIALRWSGNETVNRFDFSVVYVPSPWDLRNIRI